jgi:hypothetical protein
VASEPFDIDLLAGSLRADASDLGAFIESLANKLQEALPGIVTVQRGRRAMLGPKLVQKIGIEAAGERLELQRDGDAVQAQRARVSGGIVIKREQIELDDWLHALGQALAVEAERSERTRQALERLLIQ